MNGSDKRLWSLKIFRLNMILPKLQLLLTYNTKILLRVNNFTLYTDRYINYNIHIYSELRMLLQNFISNGHMMKTPSLETSNLSNFFKWVLVS